MGGRKGITKYMDYTEVKKIFCFFTKGYLLAWGFFLLKKLVRFGLVSGLFCFVLLVFFFNKMIWFPYKTETC